MPASSAQRLVLDPGGHSNKCMPVDKATCLCFHADAHENIAIQLFGASGASHVVVVQKHLHYGHTLLQGSLEAA